jgi:DNA-binding HxlR family transcriptional regulator
MDQQLLELKNRFQPGDKELFHSVLARIGDKWSLMVIIMLTKKSQRYTELLENIPAISRRMLTVTLRQLERDGLVQRIVHADVPPWSEYGVTALGLTLREPVVAIAEWALDHREEILSNRESFDVSHAE